MKKQIYYLFTLIFINSFAYCQSLDEINNQFKIFKENLNVISESSIISNDNSEPIKLALYLDQMNLKDLKVMGISHVMIEMNSNKEIIDTYSIQLSDSPYHYLIVTENPQNDDDYVLTDTNINYSDNSISVLRRSRGLSSWSTCFGECLENGVSPRHLLGQVILIGGIFSGFGCVPCGAVSGIYGSVLLLACSGGCYH